MTRRPKDRCSDRLFWSTSFSRYKEVEVMRKITASDTAERLEKIFVRLGYPKTITLDNGRHFVSTFFENYCKTKGIVLNKSTPHWPQENEQNTYRVDVLKDNPNQNTLFI
uniref:Integrase catalytic domain-containing protein n=1 Tax=Anopheles epiroticus TaxID=199890 RepID=A0A182PX50_9DIPT